MPFFQPFFTLFTLPLFSPFFFLQSLITKQPCSVILNYVFYLELDKMWKTQHSINASPRHSAYLFPILVIGRSWIHLAQDVTANWTYPVHFGLFQCDFGSSESGECVETVFFFFLQSPYLALRFHWLITTQARIMLLQQINGNLGSPAFSLWGPTEFLLGGC